MMRLLLWFTLLWVSVFTSQPSFALAKFGHQIVCQLAFDHLSLTKQQRIIQLLQAVPLDQKIAINQYNYQKKTSTLTFEKACTWPDAIKRQKQYSRYNPWHYMNVPRNADNINQGACQHNCLPLAIIKHQQQLASSSITKESAQALMFVGHWLGDIHQPLHVSYASDLGGNRVQLKNKAGDCKNLHAYWDTCLIKQANRTKKNWLKRLDEQWGKADTPRYQPEQVWQWADESYQYIRSPAFQYCQLTGQSDTKLKSQSGNLVGNQQYCHQPKKAISLASDYASRYLPLMEQRLLLAAKRLNQLLEASL